MSNSSAMPRTPAVGDRHPGGQHDRGFGRGRPLRSVRCAGFLPLPFPLPPPAFFGGGGASSLRQPVSSAPLPCVASTSSSTSSTSPPAPTADASSRVVALALEGIGEHVPGRRARARPRRGSPAAAPRSTPFLSRAASRSRDASTVRSRSSSRDAPGSTPELLVVVRRSCASQLLRVHRAGRRSDPLLRHRVAVADGDRAVVEGVEVDGDAQRRAHLVLATVAAADRTGHVDVDHERRSRAARRPRRPPAPASRSSTAAAPPP